MGRLAPQVLPIDTGRVCHFCKLPIPADESAVQDKTETAWAHFECWYDGGPCHPRDPQTGQRLCS